MSNVHTGLVGTKSDDPNTTGVAIRRKGPLWYVQVYGCDQEFTSTSLHAALRKAIEYLYDGSGAPGNFLGPTVSFLSALMGGAK